MIDDHGGRFRYWREHGPPPGFLVAHDVLVVVDTHADPQICLRWRVRAWPERELPAEVIERAYRDMIADLLWQALPECVVPGCTERAPEKLYAGERGRFAGRAWARGDEIRLCSPHCWEVLRAAYSVGLDQLEEWMKTDVMYDPLDVFDMCTDLLNGDKIERSRARIMRIYQRP